MRVPHEIEVNLGSAPQDALIGGIGEARLTVEYLVEPGATSPEVTVTATTDGVTSEWSDSGPAPGFYAREDVLSALPGTRVTIAATDAIVRLRWCETICC
ncbi:MAG: hypothetical protein GY947_05315 [Rhodobacteraceae bacterium]|nr:hypothetical protein [Paracoccaceae bacterium]